MQYIPRINDHRNEVRLLVLLPFRCQIDSFDHRHLAMSPPGPVTYQATLAFFILCRTCSRIAPQFISLSCVISRSSCLDWAGPDNSMFQPNYRNATVLAPFAGTFIFLQSTPVELVDHPWLVGMLKFTSSSIGIDSWRVRERSRTIGDGRRLMAPLIHDAQTKQAHLVRQLYRASIIYPLLMISLVPSSPSVPFLLSS